VSDLPAGVSAADYAKSLRHVARLETPSYAHGNVSVARLLEIADEAQAVAEAEWHDYSEWVAGRRP